MLRLTFSFLFLDDSADSHDRVLLSPDSLIQIRSEDSFLYI
jgi:hypothetical protein